MTQGYSVIWSTLTPGQKRVMDVFVGGKKARTYKKVAESLFGFIKAKSPII